MKTLSLKLDDEIFEETESITSVLKLPRNRYINDALRMYNRFHKRRRLKAQLEAESGLLAAESMDVLYEFEGLGDED
jgi:predicted transcriptional regulator